VNLPWAQVDLTQGLLHVHRKKRGTSSTHPLRGPELRALRRLQRDYPGAPQVFVSEQGGPLSTSSVRRILTRAGELAALPFPVHPHMLRHACGFKLANDGHDTRAIQHYLGHRNIQHTVLYTELAADRFKGFLEGVNLHVHLPPFGVIHHDGVLSLDLQVVSMALVFLEDAVGCFYSLFVCLTSRGVSCGRKL
jgi:site-specific recombinase XerD